MQKYKGHQPDMSLTLPENQTSMWDSIRFGGAAQQVSPFSKVRLVIGKDLRVAARGHDIGSKGYDRVQLFDQMAIRAASEHGAILSNTDKIECEQNETFLL